MRLKTRNWKAAFNSPVDNKKIHARHHVSMRPLDSRKLQMFCELELDLFYRIKFTGRKLIFFYQVRFTFSFLWLLVYTKILTDWDLEKAECFVDPRLSRVHKTPYARAHFVFSYETLLEMSFREPIQGVQKNTEQIWNCPQLLIADRGTKYLINTDYLGTYNVE